MKLKEVPISENNTIGNYIHYCPGCEQLHLIPTVVKNDNGAIWSFNGAIEKPTFSPSIHLHSTDAKGVRHTQCHYFIREGQIQYCSDSRHKLAGQTVSLPEIPGEFE